MIKFTDSRGFAEDNTEIYKRINNIALQVACFGCTMQEPYIDMKGVIRCHKADKCQHVIHYAEAEYQRIDPDFDDITYGRCSNCGQMVYRPGEQTKCPCCGFELVWEKNEI